MSLKAGLRTFGEDSMKAVVKEMRQLHDCNVMTPVHKWCLTPEQHKEAPAYLMFLKCKIAERSRGADVQTVKSRGRTLPRRNQRH